MSPSYQNSPSKGMKDEKLQIATYLTWIFAGWALEGFVTVVPFCCCCCWRRFDAFFRWRRPCSSSIRWSTERNSAWRCCKASRCRCRRASCWRDNWLRYWQDEEEKGWKVNYFQLHRKFILSLTINSRRNFPSSRAACDGGCWLPPLFAIRLNPRRSRRNSSNCLVRASTFATARLSSFSFSLKRARIESKSLPAKKTGRKKGLR